MMYINQTRFNGKGHQQKDGPYTLEVRKKDTLHNALTMMIVDDKKIKMDDELGRQLEHTNDSHEYVSFPLDLSQGNILQRAMQIMNGEI